ncbi:hypothetical protein BDV93DRAFT_604763 [Ceratobasidium sp. AG-I]|nr:hypothetical protein BDV93DRAFT_604763 [Ceratobasidium sp. AG-I]
MLQVLAGALFGLAPLVAILVLQAPIVSGAALYGRQLQWPALPSNLTEDVLQVAFAISPPCANTTYCVALTTVVVPRCERLRGDPGCWCGNHDPLHYCAICMSNPTNGTTPDQTQSATAGHNAFHVACSAYEELINGTATVSTSSSSVESSTAAASATAVSASGGDTKEKTPIGPIIGGAVGGVVGLALVFGLVYLIALMIKRNNNNNAIAPSSVSHMSSEPMSYGKIAAPYPTPSIIQYSSPGHVSPNPHGYNHSAEPMNPGADQLRYSQPPQS